MDPWQIALTIVPSVALILMCIFGKSGAESPYS